MPPRANAMNLKQRLAALSLAPSSPTGPRGDSYPHQPSTPQSPVAKMKSLFNAPRIGRRNHPESTSPGAHTMGQEGLDEVIGRMIFQAGVDFETRPMVVLNASALPDPKEVSYDLLLSRILGYLDLYVESDYTVVFFAAGGRHTPGWNWIWKAYRSLSRKYRKNLKRLYIVHSSFFSKMLFSLAGAIISPKFFRKLEYANTLTELAQHVPLTQIDIPPAVYRENLKHESQIALPTPARSNVFGVPLEELMGYEGEKGGVPRVVKDCIQFLRETGLEDQGLFRRSPSSSMLRAAKEAYDRGHVVSLQTFGDPHLAAVLLKKYLRDLPEPIFAENLYPIIKRCPFPTAEDDMSCIVYIRETLLPQLMPCAYILLSNILHLMHDVSLRSQSNFMDAHNLAIVLGPNLLAGSNPIQDVMLCSVPGAPSLTGSPSTPSTPPTEAKNTLGSILKICIQRYYEVFDEVPDRSEAVPLTRSTLKDSSLVPSESSSASGSPQPTNRPYSHHTDDDSLDDGMLVMPIGPSHDFKSQQAADGSAGVPPSAWGSPSGGAPAPYKVRQRPNKPTAAVRSMHTPGGDNNVASGHGFPNSSSKARSMISIDKGSTLGGPGSRMGSISVGRGTTRKSAGSGVEAISITAAGFFAAPDNAPPMPKLAKRQVRDTNDHQ
ncbi:Rho GTPase activation protein [Pleurotus pulmonarius]